MMPQTFSNETESALGQLKAGVNMQILKIHLGPIQDVCHCPPGALCDAIWYDSVPTDLGQIIINHQTLS